MKEIRNIIAFYDKVAHQKERVAMASIVNIEASSYRRIGARMLVSSSGHWVGGISGGCLEGDALKQAQQAIFRGKPNVVIYDTLDEDNHQIGIGLGCNGRIEVLFNPIDPNDSQNPVEQLRSVVQADKQVVQLHIIQAPLTTNLLGQHRLVNDEDVDKPFAGIDSITLQKLIQKAYDRKKSQFIAVRNSEGHEITLLAEFHRPEIKLHIVGDNYDVNALVKQVTQLGWTIFLYGKKRKYLKETFALVKSIKDVEQIKNVTFDPYSGVVFMTHDFNTDKSLLPPVANKKPRYLGVLGPRKRMDKLEKEIQITLRKHYPFIHSPIGLDVGAENPEEIAAAIVAEIIAVFRSRDGYFLKYREASIYSPSTTIS